MGDIPQHLYYNGEIDKSNRDFTFEDGSTISMPRANAAMAERPVHADVTANLPSTPGYFRILGPMLTARYLGEWLQEAVWNTWGQTAQDNPTAFGNWLERTFIDQQVDVFNQAIDAVRNGNATDDLRSELEVQLRKIGFRGQNVGNEIDTFLNTTNPDQIEALRDGYTQQFRDVANETVFDSLTGSMSLLVTGYYAHRVSSGIHKTFVEAVAYELGQSPEETTFLDLFKSDNKIVQQTLENFATKNAMRVATDAIFFGRQVGEFIPALSGLKSHDWGALGLASKGLLLASETQRTHTSIFDDLQNLIDRRLNPQQGLGDQMRPSDLIDLYQKYHYDYEPEKQFRDTTFHNASDGGEWRKVDAIFSHAADLMNSTYKYKHNAEKNPDPEEALLQDALSMTHYFTLPKYIHLLGNDMIDRDKPEQTLALIEIASRYSVLEADNVFEALQNGADLVDLLQTRPVNIERALNGDISPELRTISAKAREVDRADAYRYINAHPDYKAEYNRIVAEKLAKQEVPLADIDDITPEGTLSRNAAQVLEDLPEEQDALRNETKARDSQSEQTRGERSNLPNLSFFPADSNNMPASSNDSQPQTTVHEPQQVKQMLDEHDQSRSLRDL